MNFLSQEFAVAEDQRDGRSSSLKSYGNRSDLSTSTDDESYNSSSTGFGSRKRRTPLSFPRMRQPRDGYANSDDETGTHNSSSTMDGFVSDSVDSKAEDVDEDDLPTPTATAKAATNTEDVNELLSQELLKMSLLDRTDIQEEIHGVRCLSLEESPELLQQALVDFKNELDALPDSKKKTYNQIVAVTEEARRNQLLQNCNNQQQQTQQQPFGKSQHQQRQYYSQPKHYAIDDVNFRLRFLRAELFDPKRAVLRFVNYFEFVHEFWGFGIVSKRQVRLSDFSKEELKFFKKGYFQLLPFRDRSGRRVVVILGEDNTDTSNGKKNHGSYDTDPTTKAKCYFYLWDVASRDSVESQRKGVVAIAHPNGICFELQNHELYLVHRLSVSVPTRMVASHNFCHDFSGYKLLAKVVVAHVISGSKHKQIIRQKFHVGLNDTEMRYYLQGFGIPIEFFPLTETGTIKLNYFNKWLKTRNYLEDKEEAKTPNGNGPKKKKKDKNLVVVECPLLNDVVFRQGKPYKANPGNDVLRDSILEELNRKMTASLKSKDNGRASSGKSNENGHGSHKTNGHTGENKSNGSSNGGSGNKSNGHCNGGSDTTEHFCNWLVDEIENNRKGRFLTWDGTLNTWVQMFDRFKIRRKISVSLYNYEKRHSVALGKMQKKDGKKTAKPKSSASSNSLSTPQDISAPLSIAEVSKEALASLVENTQDDLAYQFIEGGRPSAAQSCSCMMSMDVCDAATGGSIGGNKKRPRDFFLPDFLQETEEK